MLDCPIRFLEGFLVERQFRFEKLLVVLQVFVLQEQYNHISLARIEVSTAAPSESFDFPHSREKYKTNSTRLPRPSFVFLIFRNLSSGSGTSRTSIRNRRRTWPGHRKIDDGN